MTIYDEFMILPLACWTRCLKNDVLTVFDSFRSYAYSSDPTKSSLLRSMGLMTAPTTTLPMSTASTPMGPRTGMFTNDDGGHNLLLHLVDDGDDEVAVVVDITDNVAKKATTSINNGGGHLGIMIFLVNRGERIAELLSLERARCIEGSILDRSGKQTRAAGAAQRQSLTYEKASR
jgi:hypothetical protein